jgi:hypothetical protein
MTIDCPDCVDAIHYTPGWGSLGTITVAVLAIVASSIFNVATLRRSSKNLTLAEQVATRTEDRYKADRVEARKSKLIDAIADVSHRVTVWVVANAQFAVLLRNYATYIDADAPIDEQNEMVIAAQTQDMETQRPALAEAHKALQIATLLVLDSDDVLSADDCALIKRNLDQVAEALLKCEEVRETAELETAEQIKAAMEQFDEARKPVSDLATELMKLVGATVVKPKNEQTSEPPARPEPPPRGKENPATDAGA